MASGRSTLQGLWSSLRDRACSLGTSGQRTAASWATLLNGVNVLSMLAERGVPYRHLLVITSYGCAAGVVT